MDLSFLWTVKGKLILGAIILVIALCLSSYIYYLNDTKNQQIADLIAEIEFSKQQISVTDNKTASLEEALNYALKDNKDLLEVIARLEAHPTQIQYVVETKTVLMPSEPVYITSVIPAEYTFNLNNNIPVAKFETTDENDYKFTTYELEFKGDLAISKQQTSMSLQVKSEADEEIWHEVPISLSTTRVKDERVFFAPHIGLGLSTSVPKFDISPTIWSTFLHPSESIDVLGIYVSGSTSSLRAGASPGAYNIAKHLPLFTDLWVSAGVSYDTKTDTQIDLTIGTKL